MSNEIQTKEELARRKRTDFLITSVIFCVLIAAAIATVFYVRANTSALVVSIVCLLWLIYSFVKQIKKFKSGKDEEKK